MVIYEKGKDELPLQLQISEGLAHASESRDLQLKLAHTKEVFRSV